MRRACARPFYILLILLAASALSADEGPASPLPHPHESPEIVADPLLSLAEVVRLAAEREPGAAVVVARRVEADALEADARRLLAGAPAVAAGYITDDPGSSHGYRQWDSLLELPLWWPGQRSGRRQLARAAKSAAGRAASTHVLDVAGRVRQAIAELALAKNRLELTDADWRAAEELAAKVGRGVELREFAQRDLLLARSASLERRFDHLEALEESRHTAESYLLLTGLSRWPADWQERADGSIRLADHPSLLLAGDEALWADAELLRQRRDQWGNPVLALGSQHERPLGGLDFDNRFVSAIRIPLGRRKDARGQVASAQRAAAEARRDRLRLERRLQERLAHAEHRMALAQTRRSTAHEQAEIALEYTRLTQRAFELGETALASLLRARARSFAAQLESHEAVILHRFSAAQLNQALGVVP